MFPEQTQNKLSDYPFNSSNDTDNQSRLQTGGTDPDKSQSKEEDEKRILIEQTIQEAFSKACFLDFAHITPFLSGT